MEKMPKGGQNMEGVEGENTSNEAANYLRRFREAVQGLGVRFNVDELGETAIEKRGTDEGKKAMAKLELAVKRVEKLQELFETQGVVNLGEFNEETRKKLEDIETGTY